MKKLYAYEKVEVSPEKYIQQRQDWIKSDYEDLKKENERHNKKVAKIEADILKRQNEIKEAQKLDLNKTISAQDELNAKIIEASKNNKINCPTLEGAQLPGLGFR